MSPISLKENTQIWRYMEFWKFKSMLEHGDHGGLYFVTLFELQRLESGDPLEGQLPQNHKEVLIESIRKMLTEKTGVEWSLKAAETFETLHSQDLGNRLGANCWHIADAQNLKMWATYAQDDGIAIQSTYGRLRNCLNETIIIRPVKYVDFETDDQTIYSDTIDFALVKSELFKEENELRVVKLFPGFGKDGTSQKEQPPEWGEANHWESLTLSDLIEHIYVAPNVSPESYLKVEKLLMEHGYNPRKILAPHA